MRGIARKKEPSVLHMSSARIEAAHPGNELLQNGSFLEEPRAVGCTRAGAAIGARCAHRASSPGSSSGATCR